MRLNKEVEKRFNYRYDWVMEDIRANLLVIAAISIALNTMSSPLLGLKALIIFIVSWYSAYFTEILYYMFSKEIEYEKAKEKVKGSYPEVIGLIFALLIPIGTPMYAIIISLAMGIMIAKIAFGGFSHNIFNVAVVSAVICYISWPDMVTPLLSSHYWLDYILIHLNTFLETPLDGILAIPDVIAVNVPANATMIYPTWSIFTNNPQVMLGLIPTVIILPMGIRLILNKTIDYRLPVMISTLTIIGGFLIAFLTKDSNLFQAFWYGLNGLVGTIMLFVVFFVASDPVTSPKSTNTQFVYALIIVIVTLFIREVSTNVEGVLYAILFANMFVPLLNSKSGVMTSVKKTQLLIASCVIFVGCMLFIGYNALEESINYQEYDHYSITGSNENTTCEPTDASTSATGATESELPTDCTPASEEVIEEDATASASMA